MRHLDNILKLVLFIIYNPTLVQTFILDEQIYILIWTISDFPPLMYMVKEKMEKCFFKNCVVTRNKSYFKDVKKFDVILFDLFDLRNPDLRLPEERAVNQNYVFVSREPSVLYQVPSKYNGYFNLTWTYKLHSDIALRYVIVKNRRGNVIGPKKHMQWMDINDTKPTSKKLKRKLKDKNKAAAWFVSNCHAPSRRRDYVQGLRNVLNKYDLRVDTFGLCGDLQCPLDSEQCHAVIETDYYFYLSFENSMCEDYVTEKLLTATKHFAVPIVYGGADYSRFLPQGSYLDAQVLGQEKLAYIMNDTIHNKDKYYDFFKWRRYYSLNDPSETPDTDNICAFCTFLNNEIKTHKINVYENLTAFWSD